MEKKLKHLEFIQNTIARMANNLFMLKGWGITLIAALFALAAKDSNQKYILVAYFLVFIFWLLDGYFLSQERMYRSLYEEVCKKQEHEIDFSLNANKFDTGRNNWLRTFFSKTLLIFYLSLLLILVVLGYLIQ